MNIQMWYLVVIKDLQALPGKNLLKVLDIIQTKISFKFVFLDDIQGAGILNLSEKENKFLLYTDIIADIKKVTQFDWGDFFLFNTVPKDWDRSKDYSDLVILTDTTVRAIDDTYIYVYSPYEEVSNALTKSFEVESVCLDTVENLAFPY